MSRNILNAHPARLFHPTPNIPRRGNEAFSRFPTIFSCFPTILPVPTPPLRLFPISRGGKSIIIVENQGISPYRPVSPINTPLFLFNGLNYLFNGPIPLFNGPNPSFNEPIYSFNGLIYSFNEPI
uniref:Uncharacterized protein n=1 Tax=Candidatus Kentrum sp. DK TaxID=2126562 RepID=A0A450T5E0_9GAMM|nr:MAG: hypothetical protein BECKDK2373B_GA0170837_110413 [Candidatus Kentron sp. DK]